MKRLKDWYEHPAYYEAIFGTDTEKEMDFVLAANQQYGTGGTLLLEPACGAGRLLAEAARRRYQVVGYDLSPTMLTHARARLSPALRKRVQLAESRMEAFSDEKLLGKVDLAFNLVSTFRYLDSEAAALAHLKKTLALVKPGGIYLLGFHITDYGRTHAERERWVGQVKKAQVVCNTQEGAPDPQARRSAMRNRLRITGVGEDRLIETHWFFRTYSLSQARRLFQKAGWSLVAMHDFDYQLKAPLKRGSLRLDRVFVLQR